MSEIRRLLSDAQDAERRGKKEEAVRLLRIAAAWYRDRQMLTRAAQMLRHARRVEGIEEETADAVFGFGEDFEGPAPEVTEGPVLVEQRVPQLADPAVDAWCSFCCRPKSEVGPWEVKALPFELASQRRARARFTRSRARLALVIGPEGSGKTTWLQSLGGQPDLRQVEVTSPLTEDEEIELLNWLEPAARSAFLVVRASVPPPALVLQGEHGDEPLHDTVSLIDGVPHVSARLLSRVDAVIPFEPPHPEELVCLAQAIAEARGVWLPESTLTQLVSLSLRAQRGAHELATLIARIPPGKYTP